MPNVVQAEMTYLFSSQRVQNVLHFLASTAPDLENMEDLGTALIASWNTSMKALHVSTVSLIEVRLTDLTTQNSPVVNVSTGLPSAGTATGDGMPNNVALVYTKHTALRGRSFRGRIYDFGWSETNNAGNTVSPTVTGTMVNAYSAMRSIALTDMNYNMVVVSRYADKAPRTTGIATLVTSISTDGVVDSQRRRLPGRGA